MKIVKHRIENKTLTYIYRKEISESYKDWVIHSLDSTMSIALTMTGKLLGSDMVVLLPSA